MFNKIVYKKTNIFDFDSVKKNQKYNEISIFLQWTQNMNGFHIEL